MTTARMIFEERRTSPSSPERASQTAAQISPFPPSQLQRQAHVKAAQPVMAAGKQLLLILLIAEQVQAARQIGYRLKGVIAEIRER